MGSSQSGASNAQSTQLQRGNESSNSTSSVAQWLPPALQNILGVGMGSLTHGLTSTPNLGQLAGMFPGLGTAPLNSMQLSDIGRFQGLIGPNKAVKGAESGLQNFANTFTGANLSRPDATYESFMGSVGKPSQATQAALKEFKDLQAPEIMQQAALMGGGTSGGALNALASGQEQALVPFMQQDLQNSLAAAGGLSSNDLNNAQMVANAKLSALGSLGNLGISQEGMAQNQLGNALSAAGLPQANAQEALQNQFNQAQGKFNFASGLQSTPQQWFTDLMKTITNSSGTSTSTSASTGAERGTQSQPKF